MAIETDVDNELLLYPVFGVFTAITLGLVDPSAVPVFGDMFDTILLTTGEIDWTVARAGSLVTLLFVLVNRDRSLSETEGLDLYLTYVTIGLIVAPPFVGVLETTLSAGGIASVLAWIAQSYAYAAISLIN